MSNTDVPQFPRGFLLSSQPAKVPPTYVEGPLLENFYVHPWTEVKFSGNSEQFVIVLGHCIPTWDVGSHDPSQALLDSFAVGLDAFFEALSQYSGRHAVIFGSSANPRIVNDATSMRSVFYAGYGGVVGSHALLVEQALDGKPTRDSLPVQYGYPGNRTPYLATKLLTPNTYYDVAQNSVHRFWPTTKLPLRDVEDVASEALEAASAAMRNMARGRSVKMALTAGLDSRAILAVGINSGVQFETYTYGDAGNTSRDRSFAYDLAVRFGLSHTTIPKPVLSPELDRRLSEVTYSPHHKKVTGGLIEWFDDPQAVAVTGNLLEIGRSFYISRRKAGLASPSTAEAMAALHFQSMSSNSKNILKEYGPNRYFDVAHLAFQTFIEDTEMEASRALLDAFDQFYWEHRMAAWHGPAMAERDFYAEAFIPFNARFIFEAMLGIPRQYRDTGDVFYKIIEQVDPALLEMPINPKSWPLE